MAGGGSRRAHGAGWMLGSLAGYLLAAALLCWPALTDISGRLVGAGADPIQRLWFLAWVPFAIGHGAWPLTSSYLDHPLVVNLMWNNATPLLAVVAWPVTAAFGPIPAYDLLMTLALGLSAWTAALVAARHLRHRLSALAAGLLFGFSPYMVGEAAGGHLPLVVAVGPPLLLWLGDAILITGRGPRWALGLGLGGLLGAQLLVSEEVLTTELLVAALAGGLLAIAAPRAAMRRLGRAWPGLAIAAVVFAVIAGGPLLLQLTGPGHLAGAPLQPPGRFVADLANLFVPTRLLLLAPHGALAVSRRFTAGVAESTAYIGPPLALTLLLALVLRRRSRWTWALAAATALVFLFALGPTLHVGGRSTGVPLPWRVVGGLPVLRSVLPARLTLYGFLGAALLLGLGLDSLRQRLPGRLGTWLAAGCAAVALAPLLPRALPATAAGAPAFFRTAAVDRIPQGAVVAVAPVATILDARAMLWQVVGGLRFRMPWGYVIHRGGDGAAAENRLGPPLARALFTIEFGGRPTPAAQLRGAIARELRREDLAWIVVGPMAHERSAIRYVTGALGSPPAAVAGVELWRVPAPAAGSS